MVIFVPEVEQIAAVPGTCSIADLSRETSVYAASPDFVRRHCGPIARSLLDAVPEDYYERCEGLGMLPNVDVRVHRLNVGEYPAVPGWHCDGALRETYFAAPDVEAVSIRDTVLATVSTDPGGVSNFEVLTEPLMLDVDDERADYGVWRTVHRAVERISAPRRSTRDGALYRIGIRTVHRAMPARVRGWRLFFRMSMWHNDYLGDSGKVARQQQVYVVSEENGW